MSAQTLGQTRYELRFQSIFDPEKTHVFPCDAAGHVDLNALGDRMLNMYLYLRAVMGREVLMPTVHMRAEC